MSKPPNAIPRFTATQLFAIWDDAGVLMEDAYAEANDDNAHIYQGWETNYDDLDTCAIARDENTNRFPDDLAALAYVAYQAQEGDPVCVQALILHVLADCARRAGDAEAKVYTAPASIATH